MSVARIKSQILYLKSIITRENRNKIAAYDQQWRNIPKLQSQYMIENWRLGSQSGLERLEECPYQEIIQGGPDADHVWGLLGRSLWVSRTTAHYALSIVTLTSRVNSLFDASPVVEVVSFRA